MSYKQMAYVYDALMEDVPYEQWITYLEEKCVQYGMNGKQVLDLACGTGNLTVLLVEQGYDVTGVDLSEDMLAVAGMKIQELGKTIPLYVQDMANLDLMSQFDIATIFCDSLCYLKTEDEVKRTFQKVYDHLKEDGLFLFDVHSLYKMNDVFHDATFTVNEEDVSLIWYTFSGEIENSVEHELTFFVKNEESAFDRFEETHFQRTYPINTLEKWLKEAGFHVNEIRGDFTDSVKENSERIFFCCTKS